MDSESYMRGLLESDGKGVSECYVFAASIQEALGVPLDFEQQLCLSNIVTVAHIEAITGLGE